jgi:hypothetical protein
MPDPARPVYDLLRTGSQGSANSPASRYRLEAGEHEDVEQFGARSQRHSSNRA